MSDINKTRSKLTLKLSDPSKVKKIDLDKTPESSHSPGKIKVTIKGRKREQIRSTDETSESLKSKLEVISKFSKSIPGIGNDSDLLKKIKQNVEKKTQQDSENKLDIKESQDQEIESVEELKVDTSYNVDSFNIRGKIKESIKESEKEQEERERLINLRKREALERENLERQQQIERSKSKVKQDNEDEEGFNKKKKPNYQEYKKNNSKKLTYIIDSDGEFDGGYRRKKKSKIDSGQNKEYKKVAREVILPELITVADLSDRMSEKAGDVVKKLFSMGTVVTSNQAIDADTAEIIVSEFGHTSKRVSHSDVEDILEQNYDAYEYKSRPPIVTIMGHVDHGKTSLLDAMRKTDVVSGESGGITQHIGASRVKTKDGKFITFLDTPGHEAFTKMRSRGANVTDIVVLVVAADDGIKEQTIEAINHAKAANVPIIVAVNKVDKPGANPEKVKNELLVHEIISEDMGGETIFVEVSAKAKTNLDKLEEAILLQAEILELKSPYEGKSSGVVLESKIDPNKGVTATVLVQNGSLDLSDLVVAGTCYGKIRKMSDEFGKQIKVATPSVPVEILGLDSAPNAGDKFVEVDEEKQAREIIAYRIRKEKEQKALKNSARSIGDIFKESGSDNVKYLNLIIKADVHGSVEAINGSIAKLSNDEVKVKAIHCATGGITESDISLASASQAIILGFNTRANIAAREQAKDKGTEIRYYSVIYDLVDDLKALLSGMLEPIKSEEYLGQATIKEIFKVSGSGKIAGCMVNEGVIRRNANARLLRENVVIHDGKLKTIKRFKEDVKEVKSGFECGLSFENYEDIKENDVIECYEITQKARTI